MACQAADRRRDRVGADDAVRLAVQLGQPAVVQDHGQAAVGHVPPDARRAPLHREEADARADAPRHGRDERIVGVEHRDAVRPGDAHDRGLHLGQLGQRMDAVEVQVVRADVRQDGRLVRLVADALQDDAAARRLQDGHLHGRVLEDAARAGRPGQVAGLDQLAVEEHAVGRGRADMPAAPLEDVRDHPGGGALAVGAADADHGDVPVGVADPGRRLRACGRNGTQRPSERTAQMPLRRIRLGLRG